MKKPPVKVRIAVVLAIITAVTAWYILKDVDWDKGTIKASGTVEVKEADLSVRVSARVEKILAPEGSEVKKGEQLVSLEDGFYKSSYDAARTAAANAANTYNRNLKLYKSRSISKQQFEQVETAYRAAKASYEHAKELYNDTKLAAPWPGTVLEAHVEEGELVSPGTPLFTLGDMQTVKVTIYVPLPELGKVKLNSTAAVMIDSFKNKEYEGKVTYISDEAEFTPKNVQTKDERVKQVFAVEVTVPNPDRGLKPGMPCDVKIKVQEGAKDEAHS